MMAFVAGVAMRSFIAVPYVAVWIAGLGGAAVAAMGLAREHKKSMLGGFFVLACLVGIVRFNLVQSNRPDLTRLFGRQAAAQGIVAGDPAMSEKAQRLKMEIMAVDGHAVEPHFFVLATVRRYPAYALGDELKMEGKMERPENYSDFDYVSYLARDDIFAVMLFPKVEKVAEGKGNPLLLVLSRLKHSFEENINAALPEPHAAFMQGLLLGERASLPKDLTDDFKIAGVSHIVALSGYNITIVGRFITTVLLFLSVPFAISFWLATAAIILFVLLTGAAASVVRAGIMGILVLLAQKEGRMYRMTNALAFAGAAMIFHNPYILRFDTGFQLSFLATAGLLYVSPHTERILTRAFSRISSDSGLNLESSEKRPDAKKIFPFKRILIETLSAQIMVLPLLISVFGRVSLVSPLTNILVLIAVPYSMAVGFAMGIAGFLWTPLSVVVGWAAWVLLEYQLRVITFFAHIPFASVEVGTWIIAPLLLIYAVISWHLWKKDK